MTRTQTGLTATTDERRRFRMLMRLAKSGLSGQTPRSLIRAGGSIERPAFTAELERLTEAGIIRQAVVGVERYVLTQKGVLAVSLLFPESMADWGVPPADADYVGKPSSEFVWQPSDPAVVADVDPSPQPPGDYFWTGPEDISTPEKSWWDMLSDELGELAPAGFWA